jgi:hypothetical protein
MGARPNLNEPTCGVNKVIKQKETQKYKYRSKWEGELFEFYNIFYNRKEPSTKEIQNKSFSCMNTLYFN